VRAARVILNDPQDFPASDLPFAQNDGDRDMRGLDGLDHPGRDLA